MAGTENKEKAKNKELVLKIYKKGQVEKEYKAETFDIMFGTVEDIISLIDLDKFDGKISDTELVKECTKIVVKGFGEIKELLKDVFEGVTEEELKRTKIKEVATVVLSIIKYTFAEIMGVSTGKN